MGVIMGAKTGTFPEELVDIAELQAGDVVLIRRGNSIIVIDYAQLGGSYTPPVREDVTFYSNEIPNNGNDTGSVSISTRYQLVQITTDVPARVRLYTDTIKRDADINRPIGTDPVGNHGLIFEFVSSPSLLTADLSPLVDGFCDISDIPFTITNLSGSNDTIDVTLNHIKLGTIN